MVNSPEFGKEELKDVHAIVASAAPIGKSLANRFLDKAEKYIFFQEGYGMTELSPVRIIRFCRIGIHSELKANVMRLNYTSYLHRCLIL